MKDSITRIYCVCDEFAKTMCSEDNGQCRWSSAQVMMTAVIGAARHFGGNLDLSRRFLLEHGYIAQQLGKSRLHRRWHRVPEAVWLERVLHSVYVGEILEHETSEGQEV